MFQDSASELCLASPGYGALLTALVWGLLIGCGSARNGPGTAADAPMGNDAVARNAATDHAPVDDSGADKEWFVERAAESGIDFRHANGSTGEYYLLEIMGSGAALLDYDNDGDLDLLLVQGGVLQSETAQRGGAASEGGPLRDRFYRNDLLVESDGKRRIRFTDVTEESGIDSLGYGMGAATGDIDNDGWIDLYVTQFGANRMFRNNGDGTFSDVTERTGTGDPRWSASASFLDFDRDGWLDLFVTDYVDFRVANHKECFDAAGRRDYCSPSAYRPLPDRLYRNRGDGSFEDVSLKSGVGRARGAGLGVVADDLDGDGWIDIYVANDRTPNYLWINQGDGTFVNDAPLAGVALNAEGDAEAGMGVDAGDFDGDGDEDLFLTHLRLETNTLYVNDSPRRFTDRSVESHLGAPSLAFTGFGTAWFDPDSDGRLDLLVANGAVFALPELVERGDPMPYRQKNQMFLNRAPAGEAMEAGVGGPGWFQEASPGRVFGLLEVSRGAAFGDLDNDGDTDVVLSNNGGPARLLLNVVGNRRSWIGLRLIGGYPPRDMLGARVAVTLPGGAALVRRVRTDGSYCSAHDPRVLVGLADGAAIDSVRVRWPDGTIEVWRGLAVRSWHVLRQGSGTPTDTLEVHDASPGGGGRDG